MKFRPVTASDLPEIARLYKVCFNLDMKAERYDYWYKTPEGYCSILCEIDDRIVGHNAFIPVTYNYQGKEIRMALSAGGMVDSASIQIPGVFLKMLQWAKEHWDGDGIMAFPNAKAEPFWTRILKFNTIYKNYYTITRETLNMHFKEEKSFLISRQESFLEKRYLHHPRYKYEEMKVGDLRMITKEYDGHIELMYIDKINHNLVEGLKQIFDRGYQRINVISVYGDILAKAGFVEGKHNAFVYHWKNEALKDLVFECQMIDSDVF